MAWLQTKMNDFIYDIMSVLTERITANYYFILKNDARLKACNCKTITAIYTKGRRIVNANTQGLSNCLI